MKKSLGRYKLLFFVFLMLFSSIFIPVAEARGRVCDICNEGVYIRHEDGTSKVVDKQKRYRNGKHEIRFQKEIVTTVYCTKYPKGHKSSHRYWTEWQIMGY